jgi:outer membrane biosynthesis protein TonB
MLETGSMRRPLAALDTCIDNLLISWGVDVEKHKTLSKQVKPLQSPDKWIVSSDYPENMLSAGQPALVNFRLSIGPDGLPTACHIQAATRPKEFDNAVCKSVMRRARFSPALDATGQPLVSYYQSNVYFRLP